MKLLSSFEYDNIPKAVRLHPTLEMIGVLSRTGGCILQWDLSGRLRQLSAFRSESADRVYTDIAFPDQSARFVTSGRRDVIVVRDVSNGVVLDKLGSLSGDEFDGYGSLLFLDQVLFAASPARQHTEIYDLDSRRIVKQLYGPMQRFQLHPERQVVTFLLIEDGQSPLGFLSVASSPRCYRTICDSLHELTAYAFGPDGTNIVMLGETDGQFHVFAFLFPTFQLLHQESAPIPDEVLAADAPITSNRLVFAPGGTRFLCPRPDGSVTEQETLTGREIRAWKCHEGPIASMDVRYDSRLLVTAGVDCRVKLWQLDYKEALVVPSGTHVTDEFVGLTELLADQYTWRDFDRRRIINS